jgi:protein-disulfide isomerase
MIRTSGLIVGGFCALVVGGCGTSISPVATMPSLGQADSAPVRSPTEPVALTVVVARGSEVTRGEIPRLLSGIPQTGVRLGRASAPVRMTLYGDLECGDCRAFVLGAGFPKLVARDVRAGKVQVVYRAFQSATTSSSAFMTQQVAALAAGRQGRLWQFAMLFLHEQGVEGTDYVTEGYLDSLARQVPGLDFAAWQRARRDPALAAHVRSDRRSAKRQRVLGTPTVFFHGPRGDATVTVGVPDYQQLEAAIKTVT